MAITVEDRKNGRYRVRVYVGRNPLTGSPIQRSKTFQAASITAAKRRAPKIIAQLQDEAASTRERALTVAGLADRYEEHKLPRWEASTALTNTARLDTIRRDLGRIPLDQLSALHVDQWYAQLSAREAQTGGRIGNGRKPLGRPLSARTVIHHGRLLNAMLRQGERWGLVTDRATRNATLPSAPDTEMIVPTAEVVRLVITTAEGILRPAIVILAATGIRRGELVGLRWSDIDGHSITVRRAVTEAGGVGTKATKTRRGRRSVTVGQPVIDELAAWRGVQDDAVHALGGDPTLDRFIFANLRVDRQGQVPMRPGWFSGRWNHHRKRLGLLWLRPHMLRHWHATELVGAGMDVATVAQRLGHADSSTMLRVYAHALPAGDLVAADLIGQRLQLTS